MVKDINSSPSGSGSALVPTANTVSFTAGRTRASSAIVGLSTTGAIGAWSSSATHLIVDVNGYFVP